MHAYSGIGASLLPALVILAFTASPALANSAHGYEREIGLGQGEGAGQMELAAPFREVRGHYDALGYFSSAGSGVAVDDETNDVYVADTGNSRVDEFGPGPKGEFEFVRAFGAKVEPLGGSVCTSLTGCKKGSVGVTPGELPSELAAPRFVAVDNSPGSSHDLYVGTGVGSPAQDEVQFVELNGASGGTFTLTFEGKTTKPIPFTTTSGSNEEGPDIKNTEAALEEITGLHGVFSISEVTDVQIVTGMQVGFVGALGERVVPVLGCGAAGLAPADTKCEVNVVHTGSKPAEEVIERFSPEGALEEGWGVKGRLDVGAAEEGELDGIAVDPSGNLWVKDGRSLYRFDEAGDPIGKPTKVYDDESAGGIAVNAASELYVAGEAVEKLPERTVYGEQAFDGGSTVSAAHDPGPTGFALDSVTGAVYLGLGDILEQGNPPEVFGAPQVQGTAGIAVDSSTDEPPLSGAVYAANAVVDKLDMSTLRLEAETQPASAVTATSMTLNGTVNPEGSPIEECVFEYGTSTEYGQKIECEEKPAEIGSGTSSVEVHAQIAGLRGGTAYYFRVVARKGATTVPGNDVQESTSTVPVLSGEEATEVTVSSAQLNALVNPEGVQVSRCEFEFIEAAKYKTSAPNPYVEGHVVKCEQTLAQIGFGTEPVPVSARITGLEPNKIYHWRLSVKDADGEGYALDNTLVYPTGGSELPDHRVYEMVTPPFKNGAAVGTIFIGPLIDVAENGERVIADSIQCYAGSPSCTAQRLVSEGEPFEFTRTS